MKGVGIMRTITFHILLFCSYNITAQNLYEQNFRKGYYYLDASIEQAAEYFGKAIMSDSSQPAAYLYRGLALYKLDRFEEALKDWQQCLTLDSSLVKVNVFISYAYRGLNNWDKALASFNEYMDHTGNDSTSFNWIMRGKIRQVNGDLSGALEDFKQAVLMSPDQEKYRFYLFLSELEQRNFNAALEQVNKMIELNPEFYGYYFYKGNVYFQIRKFNEAINNYTISINKNSNNPDGYFRRAWAADTLNNSASALEDYSKAIELKADDGAYYARRGNLLFRLSRRDEACLDWNKANELRYYRDYEKLNQLCK